MLRVIGSEALASSIMLIQYLAVEAVVDGLYLMLNGCVVLRDILVDDLWYGGSGYWLVC